MNKKRKKVLFNVKYTDSYSPSFNWEGQPGTWHTLRAWVQVLKTIEPDRSQGPIRPWRGIGALTHLGARRKIALVCLFPLKHSVHFKFKNERKKDISGSEFLMKKKGKKSGLQPDQLHPYKCYRGCVCVCAPYITLPTICFIIELQSASIQ